MKNDIQEINPLIANESTGFAKLLRFIGASLVLFGAVSYLLEGWYSVSDVSRYLKFLSITSLLSIMGILVAIFLKDYRGARTFIALAVAAIPVNFCQLGAFIYSVMTYKKVPENLTPYLTWEAPSINSVILLLSLSLPVLTGVAWISFSILGRKGRATLLPALLGLNALLLIPVRDLYIISILAAFAGYLAYSTSLKLNQHTSFEGTFEGMLCKIMLWVPSAILLMRTALIYDPSQAIFGILAIYLGVFLVSLSRMFDLSEQLEGLVEFLGAVALTYGLILEQLLIADRFGIISPESYSPFLALLTVLNTELIYLGFKIKFSGLRIVSYTAACIISCMYTISAPSYYQMSLSIGIGLIGVISGKQARSRYVFEISRITTLIGLTFVLSKGLPELIQSWLSVSLLGVVCLILASLVEVRSLALSFVKYED